METPRARVIRGDDAEATPGPPTPGMDRHQLVDDDRVWVGRVRTEAGLAGGWHTHGDRDSYVYILDGSIAIEFGPGGRERVVAGAGDLVVNPARLVHREITGADGPGDLLVVRVGSGPLNVNLDGPDPA